MYGTYIILGSLGAYLGNKLEEDIIIWSTSFGGAYLTVRAAAMVFGGWLTVEQMKKLAGKGNKNFLAAYPNKFLYYVGGLILLTIIGIVVQYYMYFFFRASINNLL